jgi:hypothetical protein
MMMYSVASVVNTGDWLNTNLNGRERVNGQKTSAFDDHPQNNIRRNLNVWLVGRQFVSHRLFTALPKFKVEPTR